MTRAPVHHLRPIAGLAVLVAVVGLVACSDVTDQPLPPSGPAAKAHPAGWLQEDADGFHGNVIRQAGWDMTECQSCHGQDYAGGFVDVSCVTCHAHTPEGCTTCHGASDVSAAPPKDLAGNTSATAQGVGAHQAHLATAITAALECGDCHVFRGFDDAAHIDTQTPGRAEVTFGARAALDGAQPSYDAATATCANTYCHGQGQTVVWNQVGTGQAACGTCHALPPGPETGHIRLAPGASCEGCHGAVVDADNKIVNPALHMNGEVDFL